MWATASRGSHVIRHFGSFGTCVAGTNGCYGCCAWRYLARTFLLPTPWSILCSWFAVLQQPCCQRFVGHPPKVSEIWLLFHRFGHPRRVQNGAQIHDFFEVLGIPGPVWAHWAFKVDLGSQKRMPRAILKLCRAVFKHTFWEGCA